MQQKARKIAGYLKSQSEIEIVTHQDADGLTAGTIAKIALQREGIESKITVLKQLDDTFIQNINAENDKIFWFTDLGSGNLDLLKELNVVITDHHEIQTSNIEPSLSARSDLMKLTEELTLNQTEFEFHLNPHLYNLNGAEDISGAGVTYLVAKEMNKENKNLSSLAIIGAVGDLQDIQHGRLIGTNRKILSDAEDAGLIKSRSDIRFFGRETRPIHRLLMYASEPLLPGLSQNEQACIKFFKNMRIPVKSNEHWRTWVNLTADERKEIISEITLLLINNGHDHKVVERLIGEVYILPKEEQGTELHDAKEFATLLNSCGRYQASDIAIELCLGNRTNALTSAKKMLKGHRSNLVMMLKIVKNIGIKKLSSFQYFHAEDKINENIIGTVTGMVLKSEDVDQNYPLVALTNCDDGKNVKVSSRANSRLLDSGLNLSDVIHVAAEHVGGIGGGHNIAAGAQIPKGTESKFLSKLDEILQQ